MMLFIALLSGMNPLYEISFWWIAALIVLLILVSFPFLLYCSIAAELRLGKVILALYTAYLVEICVLMGQILLSPHK